MQFTYQAYYLSCTFSHSLVSSMRLGILVSLSTGISQASRSVLGIQQVPYVCQVNEYNHNRILHNDKLYYVKKSYQCILYYPSNPILTYESVGCSPLIDNPQFEKH